MGATANSTKRLTNTERNSFSVSPDLQDIVIGLILGDLYISRRYDNAKLEFEQGLVNKDYIFHLYDLFKDYSNSEPKISDRKPNFRTNKIYTRVRFQTKSLPCFNEYHNLFYVNRIKKIPLNIGELLTARGLAYWAMDDGSKAGSGFHLNTNSYTLEELLLLIKVLKENFDLDCNLHIHRKDQYRIYVKIGSPPSAGPPPGAQAPRLRRGAQGFFKKSLGSGLSAGAPRLRREAPF